MRMGIIIIVLAAFAVLIVQMRRQEMTLRHQMQSLRAQEVKIRRTLWEQQVRLGHLTAPETVRRRAEEMALGLVEKAELARRTAENKQPATPLWER